MRPALPSADEIARLPPDGGPDFNRLIHEKSPYLLQHARNPVDWYPWGPEAFAHAKLEDKPVFLSVGYSTCHWCHVMERESFENDEVAQILNGQFVAIKVDREERPDVDEIYMTATQILTGQGGWPNSVWLTPDGRPWFAGTYFPPSDAYGRPGFKTILLHTAKVWRDRRKEIEAQADQLAHAVRQVASLGEVEAPSQDFSRDLMARTLRVLTRTFDNRRGGFGGAPKFPPHGSLAVLLYEFSQRKDSSLLAMATRTLDAMALGGIHDHIGGGFHRYSTDEEWFLPHFEKMLYDNAQLARVYAEAYALIGEIRFRRVAEGILDWVLREMTSPEGGFYSALDADSEGVEGKFFLWTPEEVAEVLGQEEGELFCRIYNITADGNFREDATGHRPGGSIPYLDRPLAETALRKNTTEDALWNRLAMARTKLLARRNRRVWPYLDDKVLVAWNGLMIGSLAYAGRAFAEPRYIQAAQQAADFLLACLRKEGQLLHTWREGTAKLDGFLDDHAFFADGLLDLHQVTGDERYLAEAKALADSMIRRFRDTATGGFYYTAHDQETLLARTKDVYDKAIPSGNGGAAHVLVRLGQLTEDPRYYDEALAAFRALLPVMYRAPRGTESLILAATVYLDSGGTARLAGAATTGESKSSKRDTPDASLHHPPVRLDFYLSTTRVAPGGSLRAALRLAIDPGWHVNSDHPLQDYLIPTQLRLQENLSAGLVDLHYPKGTRIQLPFSPDPLSVYQGEAWITGVVQIETGAAPGRHTLDFQVTAQPCNASSCLAPQRSDLSVPIEIVPDAVPEPLRHAVTFQSIPSGS